uniref:Truncated SxtDIOX n=1 Tax=Heteroscytonema crispum UCFS10 TaxID=1885250 RepID=A0A3G2KSK5_9CYAN|nr:truncated SxtDIOX [Heteroscytonema crispum UCFS10]
MDNSLDVSHFPFVHDGWLGDRNYTEVEDYEVKVDKDSLTMGKYQFHASKFNNNTQDNSRVTSYSMSHPLCQYCSTEASEIRIVDLMTITPIDEDNSVLRYLIMWKDSKTLDSKTLESKILAKFDQTIEEDIRILHSQQPTRLPLLAPKQINTQWFPHEVHVPSDRCTVAYRRWLKELGVTYGVC